MIEKQTAKVQDHIEEIKTQEPEEALILNSNLKATIKVNTEALRQVTTTKKIEKISTETESPSSETEEVILVDVVEPEESAIQEELIIAVDKEISQEQAGEKKIVEPMPTSEGLSAVDDISLKEDKDNKQKESEEFRTIEVSFAENLLQHIEAEVKQIEAFEVEVSEEIIKNEEKKDSLTEEIGLNLFSSEEIKNDVEKEVEKISEPIAIDEEIKSLEDILEIKSLIKDEKDLLLKNHLDGEPLPFEMMFDETSAKQKADLLIQERKYKQAFLIFEEILSYYKEQSLIKKVESSFGLEIERQAQKEL